MTVIKDMDCFMTRTLFLLQGFQIRRCQDWVVKANNPFSF